MSAEPDEPERWVPEMKKEPGKQPVRVEEWTPVRLHGDGGPAKGPDEPDELLRRFFEMREIPRDAEVVVAPSMRAAMDVPLKLLVVFALFYGPLAATGLFVDQPPFVTEHGPLWWLFNLWQFWPLLIFVFYPALRLRFTRYVVDAEGVRSRTQLIAVNESRISWQKVTAIQYRRTLFDRLLGLERLSITAYGERGATVRMVGLRNAKHLRDLTAKKMREHATAESIFSND